MRILFVTHYAGFYGANKSLLGLMTLLRDQHGVEPCVLLHTDGPMCEHLRQAGIPYRIEHYYWWINDKYGLLQYLLSIRKEKRNRAKAADIATSVLSMGPIDMVYTNSVCTGMGVYLAEHLHVPHIWQFRECLGAIGYHWGISRRYARRLMAHEVNSRFIMISDYMQHEYANVVPENRCSRVYNGVTMVVPEDKSYTPDDQPLHCAIVGVVTEQKNALETIRAIGRLAQQGIMLHLHLIGYQQMPYIQKIWRAIDRYNIGDRVHMDGHRDDIASALRRMDIGMAPFRGEAFGRATVEYMLMGMPVVAGRSGANPEVVHDGESGWLYDSGNVEALADILRQLDNDRNLVRTMGQRARQYALAHFSAEENARQIYEIIKEIKH